MNLQRVPAFIETQVRVLGLTRARTLRNSITDFYADPWVAALCADSLYRALGVCRWLEIVWACAHDEALRGAVLATQRLGGAPAVDELAQERWEEIVGAKTFCRCPRCGMRRGPGVWWVLRPGPTAPVGHTRKACPCGAYLDVDLNRGEIR